MHISWFYQILYINDDIKQLAFSFFVISLAFWNEF